MHMVNRMASHIIVKPTISGRLFEAVRQGCIPSISTLNNFYRLGLRLLVSTPHKPPAPINNAIKLEGSGSGSTIGSRITLPVRTPEPNGDVNPLGMEIVKCTPKVGAVPVNEN